MPSPVVRRLLIPASAVALLVVFPLVRGQERRQPPAPRANAPAATPIKKIYYGVLACYQCHSTPPQGFDEPLICRCNEYPKWAKEDKHRNAYNVLLEQRSKNMGKILGWNVAEDKRCLACHGVAIADPKQKDKSFKLTDGVSCVVCHGPYKEWIVMHGFLPDREKWRALSRKEKADKFGMTDLWDPVHRTHLCASCHIGDAKEGKFVTHEMYAAGHPPLPSFEVTSFSDQMPRHWQYLREKKASVQKEQGYNKNDLEQTKLILVGALVEFRDSMQLLGDQARDCEKNAANPERADLDLSNFDCYACHHDLKSTSWRQKRGYAGKPGRPGMHAWPTALLKLAADFAAPNEADHKALLLALRDDMKSLQSAFDIRPFGNPAKIVPAADALVKWSDQVARQVTKRECSPKEARRLLTQIPKLFKGELLDYDSARQIAWALDIMLQELKLDKEPEMRKTVEALKKELNLELPAGSKRSILGELQSNLDKMNKYDPEKFQKLLDSLGQSVAGNR